MGGRWRSLDGLRGLGAVLVIVEHCVLVSKQLARPLHTARPPLHGWAAVVEYSPVHLLWSGGEAVLVFFILSGFVLSLPTVRGRALPWRAYAASRVARICVPAFAGLIVAFWQARDLRPAAASPADSWWYAAHAGTAHIVPAAHGLYKVTGLAWIDSPYWTLEWELAFSALLPAFLLLLAVRLRWAPVVAAALLGVSLTGLVTGHQSLQFLPYFGLGVLACGHRTVLARWVEHRAYACAGAGLVAISASWALLGLAPDGLRWVVVETALTGIGAVLLFLAFLAGPLEAWASTSRVVQWLGLRSFSIYLVHEPLLVSTAYLLGGHPPPWLLLVICLPMALLAGEVFGRVVETPAHRLATSLGRSLAARSTASAQPA